MTWNWKTSTPNCDCTLTSRVTCDRYHPPHQTQEKYREAYARTWEKAWREERGE